MAIEDRFSSPDDLLQVLAPLDEDGRRCMYQQIPFPFQLPRRPVASTGSSGRRWTKMHVPTDTISLSAPQTTCCKYWLLWTQMHGPTDTISLSAPQTTCRKYWLSWTEMEDPKKTTPYSITNHACTSFLQGRQAQWRRITRSGTHSVSPSTKPQV